MKDILLHKVNLELAYVSLIYMLGSLFDNTSFCDKWFLIQYWCQDLFKMSSVPWYPTCFNLYFGVCFGFHSTCASTEFAFESM
jgi:hypothetical protein